MAESDLSQFRRRLVPFRRQFGQSFYISVAVNVVTAVIAAEVARSARPMFVPLQALLVVATLGFGALWLLSVRWRVDEPDQS